MLKKSNQPTKIQSKLLVLGLCLTDQEKKHVWSRWSAQLTQELLNSLQSFVFIVSKVTHYSTFSRKLLKTQMGL